VNCELEIQERHRGIAGRASTFRGDVERARASLQPIQRGDTDAEGQLQQHGPNPKSAAVDLGLTAQVPPADDRDPINQPARRQAATRARPRANAPP
jgi:hypothetical protein